MKSGAVALAGILFALGALLHLGRLFCPFTIVIGDTNVPEWASFIFFLIGSFLSFWLFRANSQVPPPVVK